MAQMGVNGHSTHSEQAVDSLGVPLDVRWTVDQDMLSCSSLKKAGINIGLLKKLSKNKYENKKIWDF